MRLDHLLSKEEGVRVVLLLCYQGLSAEGTAGGCEMNWFIRADAGRTLYMRADHAEIDERSESMKWEQDCTQCIIT